MPDRHDNVSGRAVVEISLHGPFRLAALDGTDLTPKPHKSRALLALLALSPNQKRARRWIEEQLWSDRGPQQAAGSLRQALVDLRKALGPHEAALIANREWIGFAPDRVKLLPPHEVGAELLEGISVRDPAFRRWLEEERQKARAVMPSTLILGSNAAEVLAHDQLGHDLSPDPVFIRCSSANQPGTGSGIIAEIISSRIASEIAEHLTACTVCAAGEAAKGGNGGPPADLEVICNVIEDNGVCLAFLKVLHVGSSRVLFSKDCRFVGTATSLVGSETLIQVAFEAAERAVAKVPHVLGLSRMATKSAALGQLALHKMFSFDEAQLLQADRLMEQAYQVEGNAVYLAWRGLLQMVRAIESGQGGTPELLDTANSLTHYAMESRDGNPTVKALVSQTRAMLFGNAVAAGEAAQQAIAANPRNPLALQAMAVAKMLAGDGEAAYAMSQQGRIYASQSTFRQWWDAHHATICVATNRYDEAVVAAEAAAFSAPSLRPAYRYLLSLYAHRGDLERASQMKEKLQQLEPGFSLDRMIRDPDYPVRTLRKTGLLKDLRKLL